MSQIKQERTSPRMIDKRIPRFGAGISSVISLVAFALFFSPFGWVSAWPLMGVLAIQFAWAIWINKPTHPYRWVFDKLVLPRLKAEAEMEDLRPVNFARKIGLALSVFGVLSGLILPVGIAIAAGFIFFAAFLNAAFGFCVGCQMYLGLRRLGLIRG